jgi:two-component system, cell cycle sensor histidine kinase and response regulator CckA
MVFELKNDAGQRSGWVSVVRDLTDRKRFESQLKQAQKMEAIGTLAGRIAHDYNNLLSIIVGNLQLARQDAEPGSDQAAFLDEAGKAARKMGRLTHELMSLSRGGAPIKKLGSVNALVRAAATGLPKDSGISLNQFISPDLWPVPHDANKIEAVFRNVVQNAIEAMPEGGPLTIRAENLRVQDDDVVSGLSVRPGDYVRISIQDEGRGIPKENLARIFDPYFSTKPMGVQKGMGLGLAMAHAIIQKHGGHITVNSTLGVGTKVSIYLPAARKEAPKEERKEVELTTETRFRVLLMDDEEMLRKLGKQMLNRLGYHAESVKDGVEAIEIYTDRLKSDQPFDAVILDLTVKGGMEGEQTIQELCKIDPDVKAIVSSGYFNDPVMANFEDYGFMGSMAKPYEMKDVKTVLEKVFRAKD